MFEWHEGLNVTQLPSIHIDALHHQEPSRHLGSLGMLLILQSLLLQQLPEVIRVIVPEKLNLTLGDDQGPLDGIVDLFIPVIDILRIKSIHLVINKL